MSTLPHLAANDNRDEHASTLAEARRALQRLADLKVGAAASFAEREVAVLDAANEACRGEVQRDCDQAMLVRKDGGRR
jgi:hypothetical protein